MALTEQEASIVALFVEGTAWGVFLVTFGLCLRSLLWTESGMKSWPEINRPMLLVCLVMPIIATVQVILNIIRALESLGSTRVSEQFTNLGSAAEVLKFICVDMQTLIGDGILTYRCWVVYGRSWTVAAVPALLWIGASVTAVLNIVVLSQIHSEALTAPTSLRPIISSFWGISIALNIITTCLIVVRIYNVDRTVSRHPVTRLSGCHSDRLNRLQRTIRIIIESGAIYTSAAIITCATYVSGSVAVYFTSALEVKTAGIAFNLIIIRVHNRSHDEETRNMHVSTPLYFVKRPRQMDTEVEATTGNR
ncbi:uncharacterized protein EV420DRAFT_1823 [Desarmillaria tabescens]|uniref:Uncharacterized protein n=1 Tax=Armillaria tabescens TaxID=1929756 RepID=A0AA39TSM8_ARMTA|nr:uncharacterized protein EV420DRAFT_1823 [Desarmillaria tabescens]KAK0469002.1 hypothetical protein EV420DRAFT_1823 [Desarmillaria tabescens]